MDEATTPISTTLNHVAMTMPTDELDQSWQEILRFYGDVFGWTGHRDLEADGAPLIVLLGDSGHFLFVYGGTERTGACPMDHYGVQVGSEDDLDRVLDRARQARTDDNRVQIVGKDVTEAGPVDVVNGYVRFLLPLMVEVQYFRPRR